MTWGDPRTRADSSAVRDQLRSVQQIKATSKAFAAVLEDGSVVTSGYSDSGGDTSGLWSPRSAEESSCLQLILTDSCRLRLLQFQEKVHRFRPDICFMTRDLPCVLTSHLLDGVFSCCFFLGS